MNKESLVKEHVDYQAVGEQISHELAGKMVKDFNDAQSLDQPNCCCNRKGYHSKDTFTTRMRRFTLL